MKVWCIICIKGGKSDLYQTDNQGGTAEISAPFGSMEFWRFFVQYIKDLRGMCTARKWNMALTESLGAQNAQQSIIKNEKRRRSRWQRKKN